MQTPVLPENASLVSHCKNSDMIFGLSRSGPKIPILGRTKEQVDFCPPRESFQGIRANGLAGIAQLVEQRIRNAKVVGSTPIAGTRIPGKSSRQAAFRCGSGTAASARSPAPPPAQGCHRSAALPFPKRRNNAATALPGTRARSRASNLLDSIPPHTAHAHPARRRRHHDRQRARLPARRTHYAADWVRTATPTWPCAPAPDLILLDLGLPRRDGLTLRELRARRTARRS